MLAVALWLHSCFLTRPLPLSDLKHILLITSSIIFSGNQTKVCITYPYLYNPPFNFYLLGNNMCLFFLSLSFPLGRIYLFNVPLDLSFAVKRWTSAGLLLCPGSAFSLLLANSSAKGNLSQLMLKVWRHWLPRAEVIRVPVISKVASFESWGLVLSCD